MRLKTKISILLIYLYIKIKGVQNKILNITNLATTTVRTAVGNEISDHSKYITTPEFRSHTETFTARLAKENLTNKNDIPNFLKILTC